MRALILAGVLALACGPAAALSLPDWLGLGGQAEEPAAPPRPVVSVIVDDRGLDARWIPAWSRREPRSSWAFRPWVG